MLVPGFLYNSARTVAAELDGAGAVVNRFVYATQAHVPDYLVRGGKTYRIVTDHLGSPRLVVDEHGRGRPEDGLRRLRQCPAGHQPRVPTLRVCRRIV